MFDVQNTLWKINESILVRTFFSAFGNTNIFLYQSSCAPKIVCKDGEIRLKNKMHLVAAIINNFQGLTKIDKYYSNKNENIKIKAQENRQTNKL